MKAQPSLIQSTLPLIFQINVKTDFFDKKQAKLRFFMSKTLRLPI